MAKVPCFTVVLAWTLAASLLKITAYAFIFKLASVSFGPEGLGQMGGIKFLTDITDTLAAAGILNGINTYVGQFRSSAARMRLILGTASTIAIASSIAVMLFLLTAGSRVNLYLLKDHTAPNIIWVVAIAQLFVSAASFLRAILKGEQDAIGNALTVIIGCFFGLTAYLYCTHLWDYAGALAGVALFPSLAALPAIWLFSRRSNIPWGWLKPAWSPKVAGDFFKFSFMTVILVIKFPVIYLVVRSLVLANCSMADAGLWQAGNQISNNYFMIIISSLSIYLLPPLAALQDKVAIAQKVAQTLVKVLLFSSGIYSIIWVLRSHFIVMLHSKEFLGICYLLPWQFTGDVLRGGAAVFSSLILAKASVKFYLLSEGVCSILQLVLATYLIPRHGLLGSAQAHCAGYSIYFTICVISALILYYRTTVADLEPHEGETAGFVTLARKLWQGNSDKC